MAQQSHESTDASTATALVPIGDGDFPVVARDLHKALGVKKKYADWWRQFEEHFYLLHDWCLLPSQGKQSGSGGHNRLDHGITIDGAKKIAMMSKTERGDEIRDYFLEREREAVQSRSGVMIHMDPQELMARAVLEAQKTIAAIEQRAIAAEATVELQAPAVAFAAAVEVSGWERTPKQVFGLLGVNQHTGFTSWLDLTSMVRWDWIDSGRGRKKVRIATAAGKSTGRFVVREVPWRSGKGSSAQLHVTPKGAMWIAKNAPDDVLIKSATRALAVEKAAAIDDGQLSLITGH